MKNFTAELKFTVNEDGIVKIDFSEEQGVFNELLKTVSKDGKINVFRKRRARK